LGLAFFGLTLDTASQNRSNLFTQIHQIVFHGNGGYDWHTVYNMPIWLRRFTFQQIQTHYAEEKSAIENKSKPGNKTVIDSDGKVKLPELLQNKTSSSPQSPPTFTPTKRPITYK
jgi:hypothetical protein